MIGNLISENKGSIIFTFVFMILILAAYFAFGKNLQMNNKEGNLFEDARFKVAFDSEGKISAFVNMKHNKLSQLKISDGNPIPEDNSIVIGKQVQINLEKEGKKSKVGDKLSSYFGLNTKIEGILSKREDIIDSLNFVSSNEFEKITGEQNRIFGKTNDEGMNKFFYRSNNKEEIPKINFESGNINEYTTHSINGETYYPIVIGYKEARLMKEERIFSEVGDRIKNFFGRNFIVSGILEESNTTADYLHITQFGEGELIGGQPKMQK